MTRTDVRVLLLAGGPDDPTTRSWQAHLSRTGTPHTLVHSTPGHPLRPADLVHPGDPAHGRFHAVVVATDTANHQASADVIGRYRRRFGVRQLCAYEFPGPATGLRVVEGGSPTGVAVEVAPAGRHDFGYLRGGAVLDPGSWWYRAEVTDPDRFTTLVGTVGGAPLVGVVDDGTGLEDAVVLVNHDEWMLHGLLLARGLLGWVTRGVRLGADRLHLSCHVDDVLLPNATVRAGATPVPGRPQVLRMGAEDVEAVVAWQRDHGLVLDLAVNGYGSRSGDPLTAAVLRHAGEFRWLNHTWSHLDLGRDPVSGDWMDTAALGEEIGANTRWAASVGLPLAEHALVTGVHSGLDNPHLPQALADHAVTAIAEDASVPAHGASIGPATVVPRHPTNLYAHVSTWEQLLADYDEQYPPVAGATTVEGFLDAEAAIVLRHVLTNDVAPLFAHQVNLVDDRLLLTFLAHVLDALADLVQENAPVVNLGMDDLALELRRRTRWDTAVAAGDASGVLLRDVLELRSSVDLDVPVTLPEGSRLDGGHPVGEPYAGARTGWVPVRAGEVLRIDLAARSGS